MRERETINSIDDVVSAPRCTSIVIYTSEYIFHGEVHHSIGERLLDVINQGSIVDQIDLPREFLLLTEVEIFSPDGKRNSTVASCLLNKSSIYLIGEQRLCQAEPPPTIHYRSSLFTEKKPVWVNILLPSITLAGHMHVIEWQRSMSAVDTNQLFLPLTKAKVLGANRSEDAEFEFAAVNKSRIIGIVEAA